MHFPRVTAVAAFTAAALSPGLLLTAAGPARADGGPDPRNLPACTDVATARGDYVQDTLRTRVTGVPAAVAAGDGWHELTATVRNIGAAAVPRVEVRGLAWRETDGGTELGPYAAVEVGTADGGWQPLGGGSGGWADPANDLAAHATVTYRFRFRITSDAPADVTDGEMAVEAVFADSYHQPDAAEETACFGEAVDDHGFRIRPVGSTPPPSAGPTPTASGTHSAPGTGTGTPASGTAPATRVRAAGPELAATGSSGALPLLAGAGAAAVAAGAGAVALDRRRRRT